MDGRYREYFEINLDKQTKKLQTARTLNWWEAYSPARDTVPDHVLYSDMNPTMVKVLNFDTLASGVSVPLVPSGFVMFDIDEFNPLQPVPPENRPIIDGGQYVDGVPSGTVGTIVYDGGPYANGSPIPPLFSPIINGGTY